MKDLFYVYFITYRHHTVIYTGFTDAIYERAIQHREWQLKRYRRKWKENLINTMNPEWRDLREDFETY